MTEITNITSAFSADQVVRLTSLSTRQLAYWDKLGFFQPPGSHRGSRSF